MPHQNKKSLSPKRASLLRRAGRSLWNHAGVTSLVTVILILGVNTNINFLRFADAFVLVQNFVSANMETTTMQVVEGVDYLKYSGESEQIYDTQSEFLAADSSDGNFEPLTTDTRVDSAGGVDFFELNHYGDNPPTTADNGDWWDDDTNPATNYNWRYRQCFTVDNSAGGDLSEQQLYLDFDTQSLISDGLMNADGSDIRILNAQNQVVAHYLASDINTASTRVWIQPDTINAGAIVPYCLYYGNPSASDVSDKTGVFTYSSAEDLYYVLPENAGGAIIQFGSYTNNNSVEVDSYNQQFNRYELNGASLSAVSSTTEIRASGPLQVTQSGDNVDSAVPISAAGTEFSYYMDRNEHVFDFVSPFCAADVEIYSHINGLVTNGSFAIPAGESASWDESQNNLNSISANDGITIRTTNGCPVLAFHRSTGNGDTYAMWPATAEDWYGVGSNQLHMSGAGAPSQTETSLTLYDSSGAVKNVLLGASNNYVNEDAGAGAQGDAPSTRLAFNSGAGFGASSLADSDGGEATTLLPRSEMDTKYILPETTQYITGASIAGPVTTVELYYPSTGVCSFGGGTPSLSVTTTNTGAAPGHFRFPLSGDGSIPAGSCLVSNHPIAPYFEKAGGNDETNLWSYKQGRPRVQNKPTINFGVEENGTYTPSDSGNVYSNRLPVTITNNSTASLSEYPIRLPLQNQTDVVSTAQTNGGDIRVGGEAGDGSDTQDFYLEEYRNLYAQNGDLWTQVNISGSGTRTYYIYYGSAGEEISTSSQSAVFTYNNAKPLYYPVSSYTPGSYNIYALEPDTNLFYLGASYSNIDAGKSYTSSEVITNAQGIVQQGEVFRASGPIEASFYENGTDSVAPTAFAGTKFLVSEQREIDYFNILAPYDDGTVTFEKFRAGSFAPLGETINLVRGEVANVNRQDNNDQSPIRITSTTPIIVHRVGGISDTDRFYSDSFNLYPAEEAFEESTGLYELYGVATGQALIVAENPGTTVTAYSQSGTTTTYTLNAANGNYVNLPGGSQGSGIGYRLSANGPFSVNSQADGDGNEATVWVPKKELDTEYLLTIDAQYIDVVSPFPGTLCTLYDQNDALIASQTLGSNTSPFVNFAVFGSINAADGSQFAAGSYLVCSDPVYAMYEKTGTDTDPNISDETNFLSFPQARKYLPDTLVVTDLDAVEVVEEGLYYESGFSGSSPEATLTFTFDAASTGAAFPNDITYNSLAWSANVSSETQTSGVIPLAYQVATGDGENCPTATYTLRATLTNSGESLPISAADTPCVRITAILRTGDPAYSPRVEDITLTYIDPTLVTGTDQTILLSSTGPRTNDRRRLLKVKTDNPDLDNLNHELGYLGATGGNLSEFTRFDTTIRDESTNTEYLQFNFPPFPAAPPEVASGSSAPFSVTADNTVYLTQSFGSNLGTPTLEFNSNLFLNGSDTVNLAQPFKIEYEN